MASEAAEKGRAEALLLETLDATGAIADTYDFARANNLSHELVVGVMKSLLVDAFVADTARATSFYVLKPEATLFLAQGAPEIQVYHAIPVPHGLDRADVEAAVGAATFKVGLAVCMKNRWIRLDKSTGRLYRNVEAVQDDVVALLRRVEAAHGAVSAISKDEAAVLKRRQLADLRTRKSYALTRGAQFAVQRTKQAAGLTRDMLDG